MEWISVEDRLPGTNELVLAWSEHNEDMSIAEHYKDGIFLVCTNVFDKVSHWMPLPEPPEK